MKLVIISSKIIPDDWTLFIQGSMVKNNVISLSLYVNKFNSWFDKFQYSKEYWNSIIKEFLTNL